MLGFKSLRYPCIHTLGVEAMHMNKQDQAE